MEALANAVAEDGGEQAPEPVGTPAGNQESSPEEGAQPETPVAPESTDASLFDGTPVNPDALIAEHPELEPLVKQLQGAFTQKTQGLAEERKQFEALGDMESVQQAVELASRLGDPQNWPQFHQELTEYMRQYGMLPGEAAPEAPAEESPAPQIQGLDMESLDPELQPLVELVKQQAEQIKSLTESVSSDREAAEVERQRQLFLGELQRQENAIRAAHPEWDDEKVEAAYELSSFYGGNLAQGAARLEQLLSRERELYLSQKGAAMQETSTHPAPRAAAPVEKADEPSTLREAEAGALEFLQARLAQLEG